MTQIKSPIEKKVSFFACQIPLLSSFLPGVSLHIAQPGSSILPWHSGHRTELPRCTLFFSRSRRLCPSRNAKGSAPGQYPRTAIGNAAGYLGQMYWRGEGVEADPEKACEWFFIGARFNDAASRNGLGMMFLDGVVVLRYEKGRYRGNRI